jgi:hypothetical protein
MASLKSIGSGYGDDPLTGMQEHYYRATHDDLPEEEPLLVSYRHTQIPLQA